MSFNCYDRSVKVYIYIMKNLILYLSFYAETGISTKK